LSGACDSDVSSTTPDDFTPVGCPISITDALFPLCSLKFRQRLRNLIAGSILGTTMLCSSDGTDGAADDSADWNPDAHVPRVSGGTNVKMPN
jgi:hypothetical protein